MEVELAKSTKYTRSLRPVQNGHAEPSPWQLHAGGSSLSACAPKEVPLGDAPKEVALGGARKEVPSFNSESVLR
ncbi:MAG: hypothetical protein QOI13_3698 [Paraburkholderia sp.]|nr:hypothetical protein [Paraburkholderia sp.]